MSSRRLWKRSRSSKACTERKPSANEPAQPDERPEQIRRQNTANTPNTALNALKFTLQTLSSVSANVPMGSGLSSVIDTFLAVLTRIQQTSANAQGLAQLAERINHITPIIMSEDASLPSKGQIVEALQRELQLITKDLEASRSRGKLQQFFDSSENAACLAQHNMSLMQIVTTATLANVHEVRDILVNLDLNSSQPIKSGQPEIAITDITGGFGGTGGCARFGGQGGEGEGPRLEIEFGEHLGFGKISGGTGGAGGAGIDVGGKGGTGKGPVIIMSRRNRVLDQAVRLQQMEVAIAKQRLPII